MESGLAFKDTKTNCDFKEGNKMRVAHFGRFAPNKAGQYATIKDLIKAEMSVGIDAGLAAITETYMMRKIKGRRHKVRTLKVDSGKRDGWLETKDKRWINEADILLHHTSLPEHYKNSGKPLLMCLHGRPESTFTLSFNYGKGLYQIVGESRVDKRYHGWVTFWKDYVFHWSQLVDADRLHYIPALVDLDAFASDGPKLELPEGHSGSPNIVIADIWREDVTPFNVLHSALYYREHFNKEAKIHIFGLNTLDPKNPAVYMINNMVRSNPGCIGASAVKIPNIDEVFRMADIVVTPHVIATRITRESMACGTPIVAPHGCPYTPYKAEPRDSRAFAIQIKRCWDDINKGHLVDPRKQAKDYFNLEQAGLAAKTIFEKVIEDAKSK